MEDVVARLAAQFGMTEGKTRGAIGVLLKLIDAHAAPQDVALLLEKLPGAQALLNEAKQSKRSGGGLFSSLAGALGGGGLMETATELQKQGVGMSQMRPFITAFAEQAEEKAGRDLVERIAGSIPGLDRYRA